MPPPDTTLHFGPGGRRWLTRSGYRIHLNPSPQREFGRVVSEIKAGTGDLTTVYGAK